MLNILNDFKFGTAFRTTYYYSLHFAYHFDTNAIGIHLNWRTDQIKLRSAHVNRWMPKLRTFPFAHCKTQTMDQCAVYAQS